MYSKNNVLPNKIGIFDNGGIGDWLLLHPAFQEIKRRSPKTKIYVLTYDKERQYLLKTNRNIDGYSLLPDYSIFKNNFRYDDEIILSNFLGFIRMAGCKQHYIKLVLKIFNLDNCNLKPEIYLTHKDEDFGSSYAELLKDRMIILCNETSKGVFKKWDTRRWERVIKKFPNYVFVQVGLERSCAINGALNMLGRTTLAQAMSLVKHSKLVVTVDGIFNHVAYAFDVPRVILWGLSHPRNHGYSNNAINIWKKRSCSPCLWGPTEECTEYCSTYKKLPRCMSTIHEFEVVNAIKKMLKEKSNPNIAYYKLKPTSKDTCLDCKRKHICNIDFFKIKFSNLFALQKL